MDLAFLTASSSSCSASSMLPCRRSRLTLRRRIMASPRMHSSNVFRILLASSILPGTAGRRFRTGQIPELPQQSPPGRAALTLLLLEGCPQHVHHGLLGQVDGAGPAVHVPHALDAVVLHVFGILGLETEQRPARLKLVFVSKNMPER